MTKRSMSTRRRLRLFQDHGGICDYCGARIDGAREEWDIDHIIPLEISGDDDDDNLRPVHRKCHRLKTKRDRKDIAKSQRVYAKHTGAKAKTRNPLPGSRGSGLRKRMDGTVERRNEDD